MKKILLILINFLTLFLGFSETFEVTVNKDTNYVDISKNTLDRIQKDTVLTIDSETVELGRYSLDENAEDARLFFSDKSLYIRDISVKNNSECLPTGIIGTTYTMNYYLQDIYNKANPYTLFTHEPYLEELWNEVYMDEEDYYRDYYFPITLKFFTGFYMEDNDSFIIYHRNPLFIKHIEKTENAFIFDIIPLKDKTYPILPIFENIFVPQKMISLKFKFDGDYLYVYKDKKLVFELVKTNDNTQNQIMNFYLKKTYDLSKVTWPRHADGSCDYDGSKKTTTPSQGTKAELTTSLTNVSTNKNMIVKENLKLRSGEATSTQVLTVMSTGTKVKVLELGKAETIDGINSNWVKVEIIFGNDRDGNKLKSGMIGWCYGGYLK